MFTRHLPPIVMTITLMAAGCAVHGTDPGFPAPRPLGRGLAQSTSGVVQDVTEMPSLQAPTGDITLREALGLALVKNPQLQTFSWAVRAAEARRLQAGLLPNPSAEVEVEEFSGDRSGFGEAETTVSIEQPIPLGGKRRKRRRVSSLERDVAGWEYESKRLDLFADVTVAFVGLLGAQTIVALTEETVNIAGQVKAAVTNRVQAGAASPVEETRAGVALSEAQAGLQRAKHALHAARLHLAESWGASAPTFSAASGRLDQDVHLPPLALLMGRLPENPELLRSSVAVAQRRAALDLQRANRIPDVTIMAGYRHLAEDDTDTFVAGVSVPLPIFDRNQGGIMEAQARLERSQWQERSVVLKVRTLLAKHYSALETAIQQSTAFQSEIVPGAKSAFEAIQEGYQRGKFGYMDLLSAQGTLTETRIKHVEVLVALRRSLVEIERLIGAPLSSVETAAKSKTEMKP